ncbi:MAG TPA: carboxymuconolactone decarboxylase family protein [Anaeromyxobacteraceae bacterium]|nr:carboxymuconolactone decarboxylase family protein [Anaeromyxobacteraceae bacterium]
MTPFTVHSIETAPQASRPLLEAARKAWGFVPHIHGVLAESPVALEAYDTLYGLVARSSFTPAERQVAFLANSAFHQCEYCTAAHTYLARTAKVDEATVQALRTGTPAPDARLEALRVFTESVLRERGFVGDQRVEAFLSAGFTRENVLEVIAIVATKTISNYANHIAGTPKEGFMTDPLLAWAAPRNREGAA